MPNFLVPPSVRVASKRFLAAAAQASPKTDVGPATGVANTEKLSNGVIVSTLETGRPVATVSLTAKAGSRYETDDTQGVAHFLRALAGKRTKSTTEITFTRHLEQIGATFSTTNTRDTITYTVQCLRENLDVGLRYVAETALEGVFWGWELVDNKWRLSHDRGLLALDPAAQLVEALHKAAFRNSGLGNSLYCPEYAIGSHTSEQLKDYVAKHYALDRLALTGVGCDHSTITNFADRLIADKVTGATADGKSVYGGGEVRLDTGGNISYIAVAGKGAGLESAKDVLCLDLLQRVLGIGSRIPHGAAGSKLGVAASAAAGDAPVHVSAINMSYAGNGLFGFTLAVDSSKAGEALWACLKEVRSIGKVSEAELARAKTALKVDLLSKAAGGAGATEFMASQALSTGHVASADGIVSSIDSITLDEVANAGKKTLEGKPSVAIVGNARAVPYLDQM